MDLFVARSHVMDTIEVSEPHLRYRESSFLLRNEGGKKFIDVSATAGEVVQQKWAARGMALGDINNDGKVDAVVASTNGPAWLLLNETQTTNHWIEFKLQSSKGNRDGIGATPRITTSLGDQYATVTCGGRYQSSSDSRIHFEVGIDAMVKLVEIHWPSGVVQSLTM